MFARLGTWCATHRVTVVAAWVVLLVGLGALGSAVGNDVRTQYDLPDVESRQGFEILEDHFGGDGAGAGGTIVFEGDRITDPAVSAQLQAFLTEVESIDDATVASPFVPGGEVQVSREGPLAGRVAFARIEIPGEIDQEAAREFAAQLQEIAPEIDGVRIEYGGMIFGEFEPPSSELLGLAFAIVILILAFGSVLAMGLPIGVALGGIGVGSTLLLLISNVVSMPDFATSLGLMIGLGVGIDYALFIVTRYREQLRRGHDVVESVSIAIDTSGRAVLFAGITVVISLLGMLVMNVDFVDGLALGSAIIVTVTMVASLTLLPALLGLAGRRVETTRWRGLSIAALVSIGLVGVGLEIPALSAVAFGLAGLVAIAALVLIGLRLAGRLGGNERLASLRTPLDHLVPARREKPLRQTVAYRWSRVVQARPWTIALASAALLVLLALPVSAMRLGFSDDGNQPEHRTTRQAYDLLAEGFGPGFNGPLLLVAEVPDALAADELTPTLERTTDRLRATPGVALVSPALPNDADSPTAVQWFVVPTTSPQAEATTELVHTLRDDVLPDATAGSGLDVLVTGFVAVTVDFSDYLAQRLPIFFVAVLGLSFVLLMAVFRSLLVPVKAVIMNLLSIGAAYGLMVAVFQWGWGGALLGIEPAPVEPFLPMMLFAIVFGLSMDYEVFLLSRIREEWVRTGDARESVADGLAATAKVITAAAAIMVFVFGSFVLEGDRAVKPMGFGLAAAVFLDATVVRMLLVPATMELLGARNWWLPRWLDRLLPHLNVEGTEPADEFDELLEAPEPEPEPQPELV